MSFQRSKPMESGTGEVAGLALPGPAARILEAARTRFFAEGFHGITMDDLARDLGMSKKTLYAHFATKEALLDGVIDDLAARFGEVLREARELPRLGVPERVKRVITGIGRELAAMRPVFLASLRRSAPRQFARVEELRRRNLERHLLPMLEAGRRDGQVRADVEPAFAVEMLLVTLQGALEASTLERLQLAPGQLVPRVIDLFFRGILDPAKPAGVVRTSRRSRHADRI